MKNRKFITSIKDGKIDPLIVKQIDLHLKQFENKTIVINIGQYYNTRTGSMNNYWHGVVLHHYLMAMLQVGDDSIVQAANKNRVLSDQELHDTLLLEFAGKEQIDVDSGELVYLPNRSSKMTTMEFSLLIKLVINACLERYDYVIPPADKDKTK